LEDLFMNTFRFAIALFLVTLPSAVCAGGVPVQTDTEQSASVLHVYGPGGPLPAMKEAADIFSKENHVQVVVTGGPLPKWLHDAQQNADLIFSGSEEMMSDFQVAFEGSIDPATIVPLYMRKAAILVRPGNPSHIKGLEDLMKPGHRILVVNGAGQKGLWEDVAGRRGDIASVTRFRANIATVAPNSGEARTDWINDKSLDAWLIWNIWQISNPSLAEIVPVDEAHQIYRDCGIGLTTHGRSRSEAREFIRFLQSPEGARIFQKWGWSEQPQ
jgi:accessory colonization factor AcfC